MLKRLALPVPFLTMVHQKKLKHRILKRIETEMNQESVAFEKLSSELQKLTLNVQPTRRFKFHSRENLLETLRLRFQRLGLVDLVRDFFHSRRSMATVVAFLILFFGTLGYRVRFPEVSASKLNFVEEISGSVFINRDGLRIQPQEGDPIYEEDVLETQADGSLSVVFIDDSRVTLGPETQLEIVRSWIDPHAPPYTAVELVVDHGRAWTQVVHLLPGALFSISSVDATFSVDRKALFDVFVHENETTLRVFDYLVDFEVRQKSGVQEGTLGPPLLIRVEPDSDQLVIEPIAELADRMATDVWLQTNFKKSENHVDGLSYYYNQQIDQKAGLLPGDFLYWLERGTEKARLLFNRKGPQQSQLLLQFAEKRFSEAIQLFNENEKEHAQKALQDYQEILVFLSETSDLEVRSLLDQSRQLVEGLYRQAALIEVRKLLDETAVLVSLDEKDRDLVHLQTAADRLGLTLELIEIESYDLAQQALLDYEVYFNQALAGLSELEMDQRQEVVLIILDQKLRDLQYLKLIHAKLASLNHPQLQAQLQSLHHDTLFQLNAAVLNLKERAVLHLTTFLKDTKADQDLQFEILGRLKKTVDPSIEVIKIINDLEAFYVDRREEVIILKEVKSGLEMEWPVQDYLKNRFESEGVPMEYKEVELERMIN